MRPSILLVLAALLSCVAALQRQAPTQGSQKTSRRAAITTFAAAALSSPLAAMAEAVPEPREGGALAATCLGFGCNPYGDLGFNGLPAEQATPGSMPYPEFLKAIKAKKVEGVVFQPPNGDVAYALIDGKSVRMGEGWPVEIANSWSSPTWVVRILENEGVPYAWNFDLKARPSYKTKMARAKTAEPYVPTRGASVSALQSQNIKTGEGFTSQPKMYGGADAAMDKSDADYAGLGLNK